jgi:hypothetical protein
MNYHGGPIMTDPNMDPPRTIRIDGQTVDIEDIISIDPIPGTDGLSVVINEGPRPPDPVIIQVSNVGGNLSLVAGHAWRHRDGEPYRLALTFRDGSEAEATGPRAIRQIVELLDLEGPPSWPGAERRGEAAERLKVTRRGEATVSGPRASGHASWPARRRSGSCGPSRGWWTRGDEMSDPLTPPDELAIVTRWLSRNQREETDPDPGPEYLSREWFEEWLSGHPDGLAFIDGRFREAELRSMLARAEAVDDHDEEGGR